LGGLSGSSHLPEKSPWPLRSSIWPNERGNSRGSAQYAQGIQCDQRGPEMYGTRQLRNAFAPRVSRI
jgi:hypothetical protein